MQDVLMVSLGAAHTCAITLDNDLYCWGRNNYGQVGNGTTEDQLLPVKIFSGNSQINISCSGANIGQ